MKTMKFLPIPLAVGVLAFIWMFLANELKLLSWVAFITWGGYFLAGVNSRSAIKEAISFCLGVVLAALIVFIGSALTPTLNTMAFPVTVAFAAFVIVMLELVPWFDMAPGYFLGAAAYFAAGPKDWTDMAFMLSIIIPGMLGLLLGILSGYLRKAVFSGQGQKDPLVK